MLLTLPVVLLLEVVGHLALLWAALVVAPPRTHRLGLLQAHHRGARAAHGIATEAPFRGGLHGPWNRTPGVAAQPCPERAL